ncbi:MAG: dihydroneopterin aldolase [Proteobacteria bacterium]|nr:dihydroneopterin aldolase [Pseudomonadota bacterium]
MIGTIGLRDLKITCIVGIYDHERSAEQDLFLDVEVDHDFADAAETEHVSATIDYDLIAAALTALAQTRRYQLIETFAEHGAALLFEQHPAITRVAMEIRKPAAVPAAACSLVRIERHR